MSYKLDKGLSPDPDVIEMADYWEIECLRKKDLSASIMDISKSIGIVDDIQEDQVDSEEEDLEEKLQDVVEEIQRRINSGNGNYPFKLQNLDYELTIDYSVETDWLWIYTYLLLATRNNMLSNKTIEKIDGTEIFEKISRDALLNYLGQYSKGVIFGTATSGGFYEKLNVLASHLKEGKLKSRTNITYNPQDDKLDIVAWIPFHDTLPSKLICFAQCKTGTHWHKDITQLNISNFLKNWFAESPSLDPIRTFIISDILNPRDYYNKAVNNLFIDRCRLTSLFILKEDNEWFDDLKIWTSGVMKQYNLSFNLN